jgi:ParB-like chromosome segregation protein Spo0J
LLNLPEVPILRVAQLSEVDKRDLRLALNRLAQDAEWDQQRLTIELRFLADAEFELDLVGFETSEIEFHLDGDDASQKTGDAIRQAPNEKNPADRSAGFEKVFGSTPIRR